MSIYFTADTHFYYQDALIYQNRPFRNVREMNEGIIKNWNDRVSNDDSIYILGDFADTSYERVEELLKRLNGKKYIIRGNHDDVLNMVNPKLYEWIKDYHKLCINQLEIILFHYPIHSWEHKGKKALHFYGHIHSIQSDYRYSYNVGVDVNDMAPVSLEEIIERLRYFDCD